MFRLITALTLLSSLSGLAYDHTYNGLDEDGQVCSVHVQELNSNKALINIHTKNVQLSKTVKMDDSKIKFSVDTEIGSYPQTTEIDSKVKIKLVDSRPVSFSLKAKVVSRKYVYMQKEEISMDYARARLGLPKRDAKRYKVNCELK